MGVDTRKPLLPAPTDSSTLDTTGGSVIGTDLATDISRATDKTSYSIPDDGRPITITTRRKSTDKHDRKGHSHPSQTSLLIEYFEGGKSGADVRSRPSVRVKVTPSSSKKTKDSHGHIQVSETSGDLRPSFSRRISLGKGGSSRGVIEDSEDRSELSYLSGEEDSRLASRHPPVEIEVLHKDHGSDLSGTSLSRDRYIQPTSDISSMPPDSVLEENVVETTGSPKRDRSRGVGRDVAAGLAGAAIATIVQGHHLKTPSRRRSRSPSTERITQKVMEKLNKTRESSSGRRQSEKSRSRSVSKELLETEVKSPRRKSGKHHRDDDLMSAESSLLSSNVSARRRSGDQMSMRSGTSKSSLTNPKLLETVEDAIRRLILPELKELKKDSREQQNRSKFEQDQSTISGSSISRGDVTRRVSKHSSLPDVHKSRISREDRDYDVGSSGDSTRRRKERRKEHDYDSPSERSYDRRTSESTIVNEEKVSRKKSRDGHRVRDAAAGALAGGILTAGALKLHESKSGERERRRKRRSKSRSRSASVAESDEIFEKHDIPPMPMRSDIDSELTRDSLLSERTAEPSTPGRGPEVREVSRGSPREILSPASRTPTRTPQGLHKGLGTLHENAPREDVSVNSVDSESEMYQEDEYDHHDHHDHHSSGALKGGLAGAAAGVGVLAAGHLLDRHHDQDTYSPGGYVHGRGLSPIQSVASYQEEGLDEPPQDSFYRPPSTRSLSSPAKYVSGQTDRVSIGSLSSAASTKMARSKRHQGINLENRSEILGQHDLPRDDLSYDESPREATMDQWYDEQHRENDRYRNSAGEESLDDPRLDYKHMTNYTDDSMDAPYLDKVAAAQQILGIGANPEYVHTPVAVESAVASLHDPSVVSIRSTQSPNRSYPNSLNRHHTRSVGSLEGSERGFAVSDKGSPLKHRIDAGDIPDKSFHSRMGATSPPQSVTRSLDERDEKIPMGASGIPVAEDPIPEIGYQRDSSHESDLNTNPSIIQGPMGGVIIENRDHWPYNPTPPRSQGLMSPRSNKSGDDGMSPAAAGLLGAAAGAGLGALAGHKMKNHENGFERNVEGDEYDTGVNHDFAPQGDAYMNDQIPTPPGVKDEGYISAAPAKSPGAMTPELRNKDLGGLENPAYDDDTATEDPFTGATHTRHLSGYSQGMPSPLYDGATGRGVDRIQSKDIVALMDHLTVRDAQRNARDTEILVTLVRSAAEMRNSFEEMKRFIAEQDDLIMDEADRQHEDTRKTLGGPRPQPLSASPKYSQRAVGEAGLDDIQTKRKNVFKRALKGLGMKSSNDLGNIEEMLVKLLGEVEGLKAAQNGHSQGIRTKSSSLDSINNPREVNQDGYEPEGQAGTSSTGNQSGYLSNHSSRPVGETRGFSGRKGSENRVSTVLEGDEESEDHDDTLLYGDQISNVEDLDQDRLATPTQELERAGSVPLATPPRVHVPTGAHSNENTPRTTTDKSRKHKSTSSSFFPKIMSRWSKTTASSAGENARQSIQRKERPYSQASRSGSDLNYHAYDHYDPQGNDRLRSAYSLEDEDHLQMGGQENRPPSPLVPSQVSDHPKYQAHRNSLNLQHPQPRQGPTGRYQSHLESQAQNFGSPISPTSDQWGSNPQLQPLNTNRHSYSSQPGHLSPISDDGYSDTSSNAPPPRPPKVKDEGPLVPQRPPKLREGQSPTTYADHVAAARMGGSQSSPTRSASGQTPQRKPTGPRPITSSGQYSPDKVAQLQKQRYRGSPNHVDSSNEDLSYR